MIRGAGALLILLCASAASAAPLPMRGPFASLELGCASFATEDQVAVDRIVGVEETPLYVSKAPAHECPLRVLAHVQVSSHGPLYEVALFTDQIFDPTLATKPAARSDALDEDEHAMAYARFGRLAARTAAGWFVSPIVSSYLNANHFAGWIRVLEMSLHTLRRGPRHAPDGNETEGAPAIVIRYELKQERRYDDDRTVEVAVVGLGVSETPSYLAPIVVEGEHVMSSKPQFDENDHEIPNPKDNIVHARRAWSIQGAELVIGEEISTRTDGEGHRPKSKKTAGPRQIELRFP